MNPVLSVARNELAILIRSRMVPAYVGFILILATTEAMAAPSYLAAPDALDRTTEFLLCVGDPFFFVSLVTMLVAMCVGGMSVANDRSRGALDVLITKPMYRRDVMLGKIAGGWAFMFLLSVIGEALVVSVLMIFVGVPGSFGELFLRAGTFVVLLSAEAVFTLALVMLFGLLLSKAEALIVAVCFISIEWLTTSFPLNYILPGPLMFLDPRNIYYYATILPDIKLFDATTSYGVWLGNDLPYIVLLFAEVAVLVLIDCMAFNRKDS
ncbi:MAG: ABC transporter permease [Methanocella sp.]